MDGKILYRQVPSQRLQMEQCQKDSKTILLNLSRFISINLFNLTFKNKIIHRENRQLKNFKLILQV